MDRAEARSGECTALPRVKFLSNPRPIHSEEEDEEKEEQGLPRAPVCCSTTFPSPSPSPPTHAARLLGCLGPVIRTQVPPPSPIVNRPVSSDFQEKRLKSMIVLRKMKTTCKNAVYIFPARQLKNNWLKYPRKSHLADFCTSILRVLIDNIIGGFY